MQLLACSAMTGIIWMVQLAVYPQFVRVGPESFKDYHSRYTRSVAIVIIPLMLLEAAACLACLYLGPWSEQIMPTILLGVIWLSTALIQAPQHSRLRIDGIPKLVKGNWIRTLAWTLRLAFLLQLLLSHLSQVAG